jgi:gliding motility-associated-like protein
VRTRWFFQEEGKELVEFTPDPANPIFERPEFQNPLETEFRNYRILLEVTTVENDCRDTISKTVAIQYPNIIYFPNVFTPNGDGINDVFRPFRTEGINDFLIIIYDRWGMEQFRSENTNTHWDGTVNGRGEAQAGTYFWYAKYKSIAGVETVRTGSVSLIR